MQRHSREYWKEQLREYWGSGFTVSEYSELIGQPHMTVMRWIRKLRSEHESSEIIEPEQECPVRMIEVVPKQIEEDAEARSRDSGVQLRIGDMEISLTSGYDREVLCGVPHWLDSFLEIDRCKCSGLSTGSGRSKTRPTI